jgi:YHS domain-containing protein
VAKDMRGRLVQDRPLGSVERVSLQQRIDRLVSRGLAWMMRKLLAQALGSSGAPPMPQPQEGLSPVALQRDPYCGTYVSPEISFPLEQSGQVLHFCSAECRARFQANSKRAASA